jgi:hypothetical protein
MAKIKRHDHISGGKKTGYQYQASDARTSRMSAKETGICWDSNPEISHHIPMTLALTIAALVSTFSTGELLEKTVIQNGGSARMPNSGKMRW